MAIQWIINNLKPSGWAFVIVPDGLLNQQPILNHIKRKCMVRAIISLPIRSFYSTTKKTYILALQLKYNDGIEQTSPVYSYLVSEIGETRDANRWKLKENDLPNMVSLFNQFKGAPDTFKSPDMRCKTISWDVFCTYQHWMVDRYWSQDELMELGILEEPTVLSIEDFNSLVVRTGGKELDGMNLNIKYAEVSLSDHNLFTLHIGKRVKKIQCVDEGIPCISSNVNDIFGYIKESALISDF